MLNSLNTNNMQPSSIQVELSRFRWYDSHQSDANLLIYLYLMIIKVMICIIINYTKKSETLECKYIKVSDLLNMLLDC